MHEIKCVVIGDGYVGKTSILLTYLNKSYEYEFIPNCFDNFTMDLTVDENEVKLNIWDTIGQEEYDEVRPLSYKNADVFIICFSIDYPDSFENVKLKWIHEIAHHCPKVPFILVGCKIDLRDDKNKLKRLHLKDKNPISFTEGFVMSKEIKARKYLECSAKTQKGLEEVFMEAVRVVMKMRNKKKSRECEIL